MSALAFPEWRTMWGARQRLVLAASRPFRAGRASAWGLLDQALYAGTNFAAMILVARVLGPDAFGAFAIALASWTTISVLSRAVFAEPFVLRASGVPLDAWQREAALASGAILGASIIIALGLGIVAIWLPAGSTLQFCFWVLAPSIPVLLVQDFWRVTAFSRGRGELAVFNDSVWAAAQFCAFGGLWLFDVFSAPAALAAWAFGGLAGACAGQTQFRLWPRLNRATFGWARDAFRLGGWFGAARGLNVAGTQIVFILTGAIAGLAAVGGLRSIYTLFGPVGVLFQGLELSALPAMALRAASASLPRLVGAYTVVLCLFASFYGLALVIGAESLLRLVYGGAYTEFADLLLPVAVLFVVMGAGTVLATALRALGIARATLAIEVLHSAIRIPLVIAFLLPFALVGAVWALVLAGCVNVAVRWIVFKQARRPHPSAGIVAQ